MIAQINDACLNTGMRLREKVALVTGAASGIGKACVEKFLIEGASVMATDINEDALQSLQAPGLKSTKGNVCKREDAERIVAETVAQFGRIDILVNSAGITARNVGPNADYEERWDAVMEVNVKGGMLMSHAAVEAMRETGGGSIVNMGSIMGLVGYPTSLPFSDGYNPYPVSKGAVTQFTRDLGVRLAAEKIRVNVVCPGFIYTALTDNVTQDPEIHATLKSLHPMGRMGEAEEVANVTAFLASDEASFVTGAMWTVDGGYTAQ